ncbi:MAG TPA: Ppx/GppA phosphatase family protein [Baekduia sp.]|uniref:Ppx/GppA phosphatase family protein n=1 Tax=Baekduia sp. TaxID=2600305 RepID=UPI002BE68EA6|nr:Ppx/GppA phosphatase family protein [Baekduia sp.]HMJ35977.1 Ppx/GppA phosphatase family protein [Baekduia sp.]
MADERRIAVCDLGSNSFRLVVFTAAEGWWRRTDEIHEAVRIGAGLAETGRLSAAGIARALATAEVFAHFCAATGITEIDAVATSAIRDASNAEEFLDRCALPVRVLSKEEEARMGYLAAVNSTTLADGAVLDLGGGSMQLVRVASRHAVELQSWPLGAVRMTERFGLGDGPASKKQLKALRDFVAQQLADAPWLPKSGQRMVGIGGTVRNLAAAVQRAEGVPEFGVQGFVVERQAVGELVDRLAALPAAGRAKIPGIKYSRADLILAGAAVVEAVLDIGGFDALEATEAGLREGVFFARHLAGDPPLFDDVRRSSVLNLAAQYHVDPAHTEHVGRLALGLFDDLAAAGLHAGDARERELLWAACVLHDIGMSVDYDDHHKHSRYLVLNSGLPGWDQREVALIGQAVRFHRKGMPALGAFEKLMHDGDMAILDRCALLLRLAEDLERSRDQLVREVHVELEDAQVRLGLHADGDVRVARWAASRETELFRRAFARDLMVAAAGAA